jgi:hypothetical protein
MKLSNWKVLQSRVLCVQVVTSKARKKSQKQVSPKGKKYDTRFKGVPSKAFR